MEPRISFVTLGVSDLERSTKFYVDVLKLVRKPGPPSISFFEMGKTWLALYPRQELAADAGVPSSEANGFPGFTLSHNVREENDVDSLLNEIADAGGKVIKPASRADWGGRTAYFADPDGFLWEIAWNPHFPHV
ncbi:MAG: VOC family protein [Planctomycetaceae bacterium]